ncbi:hypothetical protein K438DRAFT_2019603 [Mycena galopus ATCC 62051]|nr:hypothetical protein K438DRAFT_2019603 [Mycena galopus ATCC 62051]
MRHRELVQNAGPVFTFLSSLSLPVLNSATHPRHLLSPTMHCSTALVFALFFSSLVAAAPVTPVASSDISEVATQATVATNTVVTPAADILSAVVVNEQSETYSHVPEVHSSAEKTRRRSFRRRHP